MRKEGLNGAGSGQKLGKHGDCHIMIVADWEKMKERKCEARIEQCHMTKQCGAVSCEEDVPPDCLVEMHYIDKKGHDPTQWGSFMLWTRKLDQDEIVGIIVVSEWAEGPGADPQHSHFMSMWNDWQKYVTPASGAFKNERVEGGLVWVTCPRDRCKGAIARGDCLCSTCKCLIL